MIPERLRPVVSHLKVHRQQSLAALAKLIAMKSVSTDHEHQPQIEQTASAVARQMKDAGLTRVKLLRVGKSNPYVYGEWLGAPGMPTVFLYAHYDVQPADAADGWRSPPWKLTARAGRLFGRGAADDKGAIIAQLAVISAFLKTVKKLPVNVKMLVEGEEEIGSPNLLKFFKRFKKKIQSDVVVVCDTENLSVGLPSITYSLRGIVEMLIEVRSGTRAVHSGMGGGVVPDAALALNVLLSRLYRKDGRPATPGPKRSVLKLSQTERRELRRLPSNERILRRDFGTLSGVRFATATHRHPDEQIWRHPSITVIAQEASSIQRRSNQILPKAYAVLSYRTVPNQKPNDVFKEIREVLTADPPWNVRVGVTQLGSVDWWMTNPTGLAFDATRAALHAGYGREPVAIGGGGSIGFIKPLTQLLNNAPALLLGIEDPQSNAHAANESLHAGDFTKLMVSVACLLQYLSEGVSRTDKSA